MKKIIMPVLTGLLLMMTFSCTDLGPAVTPGETATEGNVVITISGFQFSPASLTVSNGTQVTFTNLDSSSHTATSTSGPEPFNSGTLARNGSFSFTFTQAGGYTYHCSFHPSMTATLTVTN